MLKASSFTSNRLQYPFKVPANGTEAPGKPGWKERTVATPNVVEFVEYCKVFKPSTRTFEIQQGLLANAICTPANLPARSTISDIVRQEGNYFFPL